MPARSDPRDPRAGSNDPGRRGLNAVALLALLVLVPVGARAAGAQEIDCDPHDKEVRTLSFQGNATFTDDELSRLVLTTPSSVTRRLLHVFGTKRCYPDVGLAPDVASLKQFYRNNGFYRTKVDTIVRPAGPDAVTVTFRIDEGAPLRLIAFAITGLDSVLDRAAIVRDLQEKPGGRFGYLLAYADEDTVAARLRNAGYPHAQVFPAQASDTAQLRATDTLDVETGARARFGAVRIQSANVANGAPAIDSTVVRKLLGIKTGTWYSDQALLDAQRALYQTGAYRHVSVTIDTTFSRGDTLADVVADLREDYMHEFDLGEGWATLDCFRVNAQLVDRNAFNDAEHLELTGRLSKIGYGAPTNSPATRQLCYRRDLDQDSVASSKLNYFAGGTLRGNSLFGSQWVPALSAYTERTGEYKTYLRTTYIGGEASATRDIALETPLRLAFTAEYGNTQAQPAVLCAVFLRCTADTQADVQRNLPLTVASVAIQRTRTDNVADPSSGTVVGAEVRGAAPFLGAAPSLDFLKGTIDGSWFVALRSRTALVFRASAGAITGGTEGDSTPRLPPLQERLYAGGATSVRGFQQNSLGPVVYLIDPTQFVKIGRAPGDTAYVLKPDATALRTIPLGGNALVMLSAELRLRDPFFPERLQYVLFEDAGEVWTHEPGVQSIALERLLATPGLGLRVFSPVGPIQINAGYNPYGSIAGKAYYAATSGASAPLLCVTPPGVPTVDVMTDAKGNLVQDNSACPAAFKPAQSSNFFKRFTLTVSIGTAF